MRLDKDIFPNHQNGLDVFCFKFNQLLSEAILNVKDTKKFICHPDIRSNKDGRIIEDFTSALLFEKLSRAVESHMQMSHENNKEEFYQNEIRPVVVSIGFTLDGTTSRSNKFKFTPVNFYILNLIDEEFKMFNIGLAPSNRLPYSDKEMIKIVSELSSSSKSRKSKTLDVIKYYKLQFQREYLYEVFKVILKTQDKGVYLRVGSFDDPSGFYIHAFIHLVCISGDNLQLDYLAGTHFKSKYLKCRICMSTNIHSLNDSECIGRFRCDKETIFVQQGFEEAFKHRCTLKRGSRIDEVYKRKEKAAKMYGYSCGPDKLVRLLKWQNVRDINSFSACLAPDLMHSFIKGLLEDAIAWAIICIIKVGESNLYQNNMRRLDNNIINFPVIQSLVIFPNKPMFRFHEGISPLFKSRKRNKGTVATGFLQMEVLNHGSYHNFCFNLFLVLTIVLFHLQLNGQKRMV